MPRRKGDVMTMKIQSLAGFWGRLAPAQRRRLLMFGGPGVLVLAAAIWWIAGGRYQSTDDAYVHLGRLTMSAPVAGRVVSIAVPDNRAVAKGDVLFVVDPQPYRLALVQAEAAVAGARIGVAQLKAGYQQALAQERLAESDAAYYTSERKRVEALEQKGATAGSGLDEARHDEEKAVEGRDLAKQNVSLALAALGGAPDIAIDDHPSVKAALGLRDQAAYNLANTTVVAPEAGVVYQASAFRVGQVVNVAQPLFSLVETGDVWIDANFKETQLTNIRPGQSAEVKLDSDPGHPVEAVVDAIGAGTGSEFSLLPAQNATGNWVKVTQRVPVRLRLIVPYDGAQGLELASGLSAEVTVDTGYRRGLADILPYALGGR